METWQGYSVETPARRLGVVDTVLFGDDSVQPSGISVRRGRFARGVRIIDAAERRDAAEHVAGRTLRLRSIRHRRPFPAERLQVQLRRHGDDRHCERSVVLDHERLEDPGRLEREALRRFEPVRLGFRVVLILVQREADPG